jgi:hypothetical protein
MVTIPLVHILAHAEACQKWKKMKRKTIVCFAFVILFLAAIFSKSTSSEVLGYSAHTLNATPNTYALSDATDNIVNPLSSEQTYSVTFTKSGLRSGIVWTVVFESQYFSSYADSITC